MAQTCKIVTKPSLIHKNSLATQAFFARPQETIKPSSPLPYLKTNQTPSKTFFKPLAPPDFLSDKTRQLWHRGKIDLALSLHYEDLVRQKTGAKSGFIGIYEIDGITENALIQCKRSLSARNNPKQFIKNSRVQIKRTILFAKQQNKSAEFWFEGGAALEVQRYIENHGGIYIADLNKLASTNTYQSIQKNHP